jgi:regulation of enolase protein 1 (concanavalin A-like superfamily)
VDFNGKYDAGTLFLLADDSHWSKLCFEYSPDEQGMVVSVVTRGTSDDANAWNVEGRANAAGPRVSLWSRDNAGLLTVCSPCQPRHRSPRVSEEPGPKVPQAA